MQLAEFGLAYFTGYGAKLSPCSKLSTGLVFSDSYFLIQKDSLASRTNLSLLCTLSIGRNFMLCDLAAGNDSHSGTAESHYMFPKSDLCCSTCATNILGTTQPGTLSCFLSTGHTVDHPTGVTADGVADVVGDPSVVTHVGGAVV